MAAEAAETVDVGSLTPTQRIVRHFLRTAPSGEQGSVLADVQALLDVDAATAESLLREALEDRYTVVSLNLQSEGPTKAIVCRESKVGTGYVHAPTGHVFDLDPLTLRATERGGETKIPPSACASRLQQAVQRYASSHYKHHAVGVFGSPGPVYTVVLSASAASEPNMWSGAWSSVWEVEETETCLFVAGRIDVAAHYYETGNVQLSASDGGAGQGAHAAVCQDAKGVAEAIEKKETDHHENIETWYKRMDQSFKSLRRVLPVSKERFDWNPAKHALSRDLGKQQTREAAS